MRTRTVCLCLISTIVVCGGCDCGGAQSSSTMEKETSLRVTSQGTVRDSKRFLITIAGRPRKPMNVHDFSVSDVRAEDQTGRRFPMSLKRSPGDSSKYGPYVSLIFDARDAKESIVVKGTVAYKSETYALEVSYIQERSGEIDAWREDQLSLKRQN